MKQDKVVQIATFVGIVAGIAIQKIYFPDGLVFGGILGVGLAAAVFAGGGALIGGGTATLLRRK